MANILPMSSTSAYLIVLGFVLAVWFRLDMRSILKEGQFRNQLALEGRWNDLERHFEGASKPLRPFVWFHRRFLLPGNIQAQHALFFYNQGRLEEALAKVDQAIRLMERKPGLFSGIHRAPTLNTLTASLRTRCLILTGLGRYDEAREAAARLEQSAGWKGRPFSALALLEYYCGHLDEALAQAQKVLPGDTQYDSARGLTALALSMKGEFQRAIEALSYEPGDISKFYSPAGLATVTASPEGPKLIELQRRRLAGVLQPARLVLLAGVYLSQEQFDEAARTLDQAEKVLGPEPGGQIACCRHRACSLAAQGNAAEAEKYIARLRGIVEQLPARSFLWESHFTTGRCYTYLRRVGEALAELTEARALALHPIEKHATAYWIARTHEASGEHSQALSYYRLVAADPIPSWMRKRALEALGQSTA